MIKNFKELIVWQKATEISIQAYKTTTNMRDYSFRDQMRRSAISIPSNIAEGFGRNNNNELINFLRIAKGSSCELETQLIIADKIKLIESSNVNYLIEEINNVNTQINKFISYLLNKRKNKEFIIQK